MHNQEARDSMHLHATVFRDQNGKETTNIVNYCFSAVCTANDLDTPESLPITKEMMLFISQKCQKKAPKNVP
jgi:hypothetical protein